MTSYNTIKVVARFRPPNWIEQNVGNENVVDFESEDTCKIQSREGSGAFTFDRVFDMQSQQSDVFDFSIRSTVDDILNGYNGTVFAYGQTGAGKSYTMMGSDIDDEYKKGIIPRIVEQIFASIMVSPGNIEYTVRVSYMEIYMERIRDLLAPTNDNLPVHEEKSRGVYVKGLLEIYVSSVQEVYEVMRRGGLARATAATNMNQESSRSHSIFVITVTQKNVETGSAKSGQLFLVDLAGSEKVGKTGASGQTLEEAKKINKSLSALGMVINALTDGKSTHIPYRDSKLTRILQESLGGNSRTTLIINCSPSSYNADETVSTLRFGVRAKAIKNKAKINAELSPAELKVLLKKAQTQVTTFENYITSVQTELRQWRRGDSVPQEHWTPDLRDRTGERRPEPKPRPESHSRTQSIDPRNRPDSPARPDSRTDIDGRSTPSVILEKDEREEFLRRENELQDQLSEKESALAAAERGLKEARGEIALLREQSRASMRENERMSAEISSLRMEVEKVNFESREAGISFDGLKEANAELTVELDEVKQKLLEVRLVAKDHDAGGRDEKERKKAERMASMMAGFDLGGELISDNGMTIRKAIEQLDAMTEANADGEAVSPGELKVLRQRLLETQSVVRQAELAISQRSEADEEYARRREALELKLRKLEHDYTAVLERGLSDTDREEIKTRLGEAYAQKRDMQEELVDELKADIEKKTEENEKYRLQIETLKQRQSNGEANGGGLANGKTVQQQIAEFDVMKKSLMRDLQNRCERVVELEISLDTTREQYAAILRSNNSRAQQKKMAFLERNLEQLTHVQRQLVDQNALLKKEVAIAERKLAARNDRIGSLEALLSESQEKLMAANSRFESQLQAVKERLEAAKMGSTRGLGDKQQQQQGQGQTNGGYFNLGGAGSRIAKPLRGGGGDTANGTIGAGPNIPVISGLQAQAVGEGPTQQSKRSSWFFQQRT